jgi:5-methyltetrahydrofolate--homocysteine methyltransferase
MLRDAVALSRGDYFVAIPDIIENLDILSAARGPQALCYDLADAPELVRAGVERVDSLYFDYYDRCYEITKDSDGASAYTAFAVLGRGKTAKVQCDFCALMSPDAFRELAAPSLRKQCRALDHSIYHLDGPDAIRHLDALMEIEELDALQWTCGAGRPDGANPMWYPIYDKAREAGKGLWVFIEDGGPSDWAKAAKQFVARYGTTGVYFLFPDFPDLASALAMQELFG